MPKPAKAPKVRKAKTFRVGDYEHWQSLEDGKFYFHFRGVNGEIMSPSQNYEDIRDCLHGIDLLRNSKNAKVIAIQPPQKKGNRRGRSK